MISHVENTVTCPYINIEVSDEENVVYFKWVSVLQVALIAHSMGGLFGTYFLNRQSAAWKSHFIAHFTTLNTPWEGTAWMPMILASGTAQNISFHLDSTFTHIKHSRKLVLCTS